ncbi:MFS transporter [uncultured Jatrophihabitans sp.]|uniref:MFS transporter n=1 Tax=uncultured Jatrophihabitans sp. TaxID=1610747 RepID=UPI0035CC6FE2
MATTEQVGAVARSGKRAQVAVVAVFFVHGLLFASWTAHIPHVKASLGLNDGSLGIALLGTPIGSVAAIGLAARLVPRLGSRRVVQVGLVGYCLSGPLVGVSGSLVGLMLALFLWGLFQGVLDVSMNTQAIAVEGARRRRLMNGIHAWWSIGAFAGAGAGTLGVAVGLALSVQLLVLGVPVMVVAGLLTARMLTDRTPRTPPVAADATTGLDAEPTTPEPAAPVRRLSRGMLALGGIAFASMLCEGASADWSSVYLRDSLGGDAAAAGLGYTAFALAMFVVRVGGDRLITRMPVHRLLPLLCGIAALVFLAALLVGDVAVGVVGFFALGLGLGAVVPTAFSAAGRLPGIHPGVGVAGVSGLGWAGFVLGPPLIGQLAHLTSLAVALGVIPVLVAGVAVGCAKVAALRPTSRGAGVPTG